MPKMLDTTMRDHTVIAAAWRVIARDGVAALTVRNVAAEAGLAPSSLRYTFPTQTAVRRRALEAVSQQIAARVAALAAVLAGLDYARAALLELLPLDDARRLEMQVFLALGMASLSDDTLQPLWRDAGTAVRQVCADALDAAGAEAGPAQVDHLHGLIDGLALHLLTSPTEHDPAWAVDVIDRHLAALAR